MNKYRVMQAANRHTPGREVARKDTLEAARRSCVYHKGHGGKDSTIWIDYIRRVDGHEDYERVYTYHDGGI